MPPVRHINGSGTGKAILKHGSRKVLVRFPATYDAAVATARKEFKLTLFKRLELRVDMDQIEPGSKQGAVEISSGSWDLLADCSHTPVVDVLEQSVLPERNKDAQVGQQPDVAARSSGQAAMPNEPTTTSVTTSPLATPPNNSSPVHPVQTERYRIKIVTSTGAHEFLVRSSTQPGKILAAVADKLATCVDDLFMIYDGNRVHRERTFAEQGIKFDLEDVEQNTLEVHRRQTGGKPVIYLMSPTALSATVELSLVSEWSFSAIYPVAPVSRKGALERIAWDVDVRPDGNLLDKRTASEVAYLYWEATTNACRPLSPPIDEHVSTAFNPARATLTPSNAVVLDIADVPAYLDKALTAMTLHIEARTSFITYWLPSMLRHKHIALRFLPQAQYEQAAPMRVAPAPDIVTRVFMLFRGVAAEEVGMWQGQRAPEEWASVVGIDCTRASDASLFRVLEWGGMEVKC